MVIQPAPVVTGLIGGARQKGDWPGITGGDTSTRYSSLDQINASNFNALKIAWEWDGKDVPPGVEIGDINARGLPIYVDGMLITASGPRRTVVSLDPPGQRRHLHHLVRRLLADAAAAGQRAGHADHDRQDAVGLGADH
jgi:glucose dehydrogenase